MPTQINSVDDFSAFLKNQPSTQPTEAQPQPAPQQSSQINSVDEFSSFLNQKPADTSTPDIPASPETSLIDKVHSFFDSAAQAIAVPGKPEWNLRRFGDWMDSMQPNGWENGKPTFPTQQEVSDQTDQYINNNPRSAAAGKFVGNVTEGIGGAELGAGLGGSLIKGTSLLPTAAKAAISGATGGAASDPDHPGQGAAIGAVTGAVLSPVTQAIGGGVKYILSKANKLGPETATQIAETGDTLSKFSQTQEGSQVAKNVPTPSTSTVFGNDNLTGSQTLAKIPLIGKVLNWTLGNTSNKEAAQQMAMGAVAPDLAAKFIQASKEGDPTGEIIGHLIGDGTTKDIAQNLAQEIVQYGDRTWTAADGTKMTLSGLTKLLQNTKTADTDVGITELNKVLSSSSPLKDAMIQGVQTQAIDLGEDAITSAISGGHFTVPGLTKLQLANIAIQYALRKPWLRDALIKYSAGQTPEAVQAATRAGRQVITTGVQKASQP